MQKNAFPTKAQQEVIKKAGLSPLKWVVVQDQLHCLIIKQRVTGDFRMICK